MPYWEEIRKIAYKAALVGPGAAMVGWDIAIAPDDPALIEGNHSFGCGITQIHVPEGDDGIFPKLREILKDLELEIE